MSLPAPNIIADTLVHVQCAYTSLERWKQFGLLDRERPWFGRVAPLFRRVVLVTYGGKAEHALGASLAPAGVEFVCVCNDAGLEPAVFQAGVPDLVAAAVQREVPHSSASSISGKPVAGRSAVVFTDQHFGGEVGVAVARRLRDDRVQTGLVARGGYHWSWFVARDHGPDSPQAAHAAMLEGELCRAADVVVGSTRRMIEDLAWRHGLPTDHCRLIPNFVDLGRDTGILPVQEARDPNLILAAGRLEPQKRFDLLIRAVALLIKDYPSLRLRIYGEGSQHGALTSLIRDLRAPVDILPRVPQTELLAEMRRCAVFAQVSMFEGHPKTIIEALACGTPVVVTRGPGVDDEIVPGVTGVISRDTPDSVAAAIASLFNDPRMAQHLGNAAAADVRDRLSLDTIVPLVDRACRDALSLNGVQAIMPPSPVRWDQGLLNATPEDAAQQFGGAIVAYTKRLGPEAREVFIDALAASVLPAPVPGQPR